MSYLKQSVLLNTKPLWWKCLLNTVSVVTKVCNSIKVSLVAASNSDQSLCGGSVLLNTISVMEVSYSAQSLWWTCPTQHSACGGQVSYSAQSLRWTSVLLNTVPVVDKCPTQHSHSLCGGRVLLSTDKCPTQHSHKCLLNTVPVVDKCPTQHSLCGGRVLLSTVYAVEVSYSTQSLWWKCPTQHSLCGEKVSYSTQCLCGRKKNIMSYTKQSLCRGHMSSSKQRVYSGKVSHSKQSICVVKVSCTTQVSMVEVSYSKQSQGRNSLWPAKTVGTVRSKVCRGFSKSELISYGVFKVL